MNSVRSRKIIDLKLGPLFMQKVAVLSPLRYRLCFVFYHAKSQTNFLLKPIEPDTCLIDQALLTIVYITVPGFSIAECENWEFNLTILLFLSFSRRVDMLRVQIRGCSSWKCDGIWRNVVSWSSMIGAYVQNGHYEEGVSLFSQMLGEGIRPNRAVILNVMACVYRENEVDDVCRVVIDNKLDFDRSVQNAAMDLVSWSSMIEAYAQADLPLEALECFKQMILQRILLDFVTLLSVIRACSNLASF
ncbi:pentatricopeptide repeat-containing protein [Fagus crenata]